MYNYNISDGSYADREEEALRHAKKYNEKQLKDIIFECVEFIKANDENNLYFDNIINTMINKYGFLPMSVEEMVHIHWNNVSYIEKREDLD